VCAPRGLTCGTAAPLVIATADAHGNACAAGGAAVTVTLQGAPVPVADHHNGTYGASLTAPTAGKFLLAVAVNGEPVRPYDGILNPKAV
jgi:hypothetical protein